MDTEEDKELNERTKRAVQRTIRNIKIGERNGYNRALEWAAKWIVGQASADELPRVKEFAANVAESFLAARVRGESSEQPLESAATVDTFPPPAESAVVSK